MWPARAPHGQGAPLANLLVLVIQRSDVEDQPPIAKLDLRALVSHELALPRDVILGVAGVWCFHSSQPFQFLAAFRRTRHMKAVGRGFLLAPLLGVSAASRADDLLQSSYFVRPIDIVDKLGFMVSKFVDWRHNFKCQYLFKSIDTHRGFRRVGSCRWLGNDNPECRKPSFHC